MIVKFLHREFNDAFLWVDLSAVIAVASDSAPWEIDFMFDTETDGFQLRIIPLGGLRRSGGFETIDGLRIIPLGVPETAAAPETPEEGLQRILDQWCAARAKLQNPLLGRRV